MSISGIQGTISPYQFGAANPLQQQLQQLGQALQSGNLSAAQSDFASLQQAFTQPATTSGTASGAASTATTNPLTQTFNQLASDLQSGNLAAAQKDFSTVQQEFNSRGTLEGSHFHHHRGGGGGDSSGQSALLQDLSQIGQSPTASNLASAQQTYASLQQQLQQFALGSATLSSLSPVAFDA